MQFVILINQQAAIDWGLNLSQAAVFGFIHDAATWATKNGEFWNVSKGKILEEFPLLTDKPDTVYRMINVLIGKGLIEKQLVNGNDFYRVTEKGLAWRMSEKNPTVGKKSDDKRRKAQSVNPQNDDGKKSDGRKKIRDCSEKNPDKLGKKSDVSIYQESNNQTSLLLSTGDAGDENHTEKKIHKPESWKMFFELYPPNKRGGRDESAWKKAKSLNLSESDFEAMLADVSRRHELMPRWYQQFAPGICRYLEDHVWLTPIIPESASAPAAAAADDFIARHTDKSWRYL